MIKDKLTKAKVSLKSDELTPNQKKLLIRILVENGASQSFVYVRFFEKGFSEWELRGVDNIKRTFIAEHQDEIWPKEMFDADKVAQNIHEAVTMPGEFYRAISRRYGLRKAFNQQMVQMGMSSTVVMKRFREDNDWKKYETRGMLDVMDEYDRLEHTCDETEKDTDTARHTQEETTEAV